MFFPASRPRNRKGINRLCSRAPEPAIETGQLSAFMICKPLQRVRTPFLLGHKEIFLLTRQSLLSITLLKRSALSLTDLGIHSTSQRDATEHTKNTQRQTLQLFRGWSQKKMFPWPFPLFLVGGGLARERNSDNL